MISVFEAGFAAAEIVVCLRVGVVVSLFVRRVDGTGISLSISIYRRVAERLWPVGSKSVGFNVRKLKFFVNGCWRDFRWAPSGETLSSRIRR